MIKDKGWREEAKELLSDISPYPWSFDVGGVFSNKAWILSSVNMDGVKPDNIFVAKAPELIEKYETALKKADDDLLEAANNHWRVVDLKNEQIEKLEARLKEDELLIREALEFIYCPITNHNDCGKCRTCKFITKMLEYLKEIKG